MKPRILFLTPMLALSMTFAIAATVQAQNGYNRSSTGASGSLQITFGSQPHWTSVNGTQVQVIRQDERPDYDMFRYNNRYYVYRDNRWYQSDQWRGSFNAVDPRSVPTELSRVPRENWRSYPAEWRDRNDNDRDRDRSSGGNDVRDGNSGGSYNRDRTSGGNYDRDRTSGGATFRVSFGSRPRWSPVPGTRVMVVRSGDRPDYDVFRYGNSYYAYNNDRWYTSNRWDGTYNYVDEASVPRELYRVPRNHWRHYPQGWQNRRYRHDDRRDDRRDDDHR
jgi:hypothetical protein